MVSTAAAAGLEFDFDIAKPGNSFDAHRLIHFARSRGLQDAVKERLLRATFTEGESIGSRGTLVRLAVAAGLDEDEVVHVLDGQAFAEDVRADERAARAYGAAAVPFFVIDETYGLSGAHPPEVIGNLLQRAWDDTCAG
jgi:predicted DsbA family dithiol-disulfide isomerase